MIKKHIYLFVFSLTKVLFNLLKIRLCIISVNRIGHLAECYYLLNFIKNKTKFKELVYFNYLESISNKVLFEKLDTLLTNTSNKQFKKISYKVGNLILKFIYKIQTNTNHNLFTFAHNNKKSKWELVIKDQKNTEYFSQVELDAFYEFKKKNNVKEKYICLNLWSYNHLNNNTNDFYHHKYRESDFNNFIPLINNLIKKNYSVICMGHSSNKYDQIENENLINYSKFRTDLLDLIILKNCYAYISDCTGLDYVANLFNKPMLINSSFIDFFHTHRKDIVYVLKRFYSENKERDLTFKEAIFDEKLFYKIKSQTYDFKNIRIKNNFTEDIIGAFNLLEDIIEKKEIDINKKIYSKKYWKLYRDGINTLGEDRKEKEYYLNTNIESFYSFTNLEGKKKFIDL